MTRAVVIGSGMVGLFVIQALRAAGCGTIIAVDLEQSKLDLALYSSAPIMDCWPVKSMLPKKSGN